MPPYWSLGFQLCRYGYNHLDALKAAYQRTIDAKIPLVCKKKKFRLIKSACVLKYCIEIIPYTLINVNLSKFIVLLHICSLD